MEIIFFVLLMIVCYFFPIIVAVLRKHNNALAIGMLNLFAGWTFIGWLGALIWACTNNRRR